MSKTKETSNIEKLVKEIIALTKKELKEEYARFGYSISAKLAFILIYFTNRSLVINRSPGFDIRRFINAFEWGRYPSINSFVPTNVISKSIPGDNLFSSFRIPYIFQHPDSIDVSQEAYKISSRLVNELYFTYTVLLNEVNMVTSAQLDIWNKVLCSTFDSDKLFAKLKMIFIADFFQLKPILKKEELYKIKRHYPCELFFHSKAIQELQPLYLEVEADVAGFDISYSKLLNNIRDNKNLSRVVTQLNKQIQSREASGEKVIDIVWSNDDMERFNRFHYDKIIEEDHTIVSKITGDFKLDSSHPSHLLQLKEGARVMFIDNDYEGFFKYGQLGSIVSIKSETIIVLKDDGETVNVKRMTWKQQKWEKDRFGNLRVVGSSSMSQFPLHLGYAVSVYKSAGLHFDNIYIPNFNKLYKGQLYLALTRCKSLNDISLNKKISKKDLQIDARVVKYCQEQHNIQRIEDQLEAIKDYIKLNGVKPLYYN